MSASPTSPDHGLGRLVEEGYDVALLGGCLCVGRVPYVTRDRTVGLGTLITPLVFERGQIAPPSGHQVSWSGDIPCDATGRPLHSILHQNYPRRLAGLEAEHMFCAKPLGREYRDYHEMMTTFAVLLGDPAAIIEPLASARGFSRVTSSQAHASVMRYADTASARSGTSGLLGKVAADSIAHAAGIPRTTALRALKKLGDAGLVHSWTDTDDTRIRRISLATTAVAMMHGYLDEV